MSDFRSPVKQPSLIPLLTSVDDKLRDFLRYLRKILIRLGLIELYVALSLLVQPDRRRGWIRVITARRRIGGGQIVRIAVFVNQFRINRLNKRRFVPTRVAAVLSKNRERHIRSKAPPVYDQRSHVLILADLGSDLV